MFIILFIPREKPENHLSIQPQGMVLHVMFYPHSEILRSHLKTICTENILMTKIILEQKKKSKKYWKALPIFKKKCLCSMIFKVRKIFCQL